MRNMAKCRRGLQCRYQVRCPCLGKSCSSPLKGGPQVTVGNSKFALTCAVCLWCQCPRGWARCEGALGHALSVWSVVVMGPVTAESPCEHLLPRKVWTDHGMIVLLSLSLGALGFRYSQVSLLLQGVVERNVLLWDALLESDPRETDWQSVKNKIKGRLKMTEKLKTGLS